MSTYQPSVSDVLMARARMGDALGRPVAASFAAHVLLIALAVVLPASWFAQHPPDKVMTISLGSGAVGRDPNGMTALAGKKVDEVVPPTKRPEPILPTAPPKSTAMTEPVKGVDVKKAETKPAPPAPTPAPPKTSKGAALQQGNAVAATTASGVGVGLSSGGLGGVPADFEFCCKDYIAEMTAAIQRVWQPNQGATGQNVVEFTIDRSGALSNIKVLTPSGNPNLDLASIRAMTILGRLPPLPDQYTGQRLIIALTFGYTR